MNKDVLKKIGKGILNVVKIAMAPILLIFLFIFIIIILLASAVYFITVDDGTFKEDDWTTPGWGVAQNVNSVVASSDGSLSTSYTAQELWDKMIEENGRVDEYLDGPEELAKLMNAEIVTQYPDTRANPDEEINWDEILDINSNDKLQGIIKFKRNLTTGTTVLSNEELTAMETDYESYQDAYKTKKQEEQEKNEDSQGNEQNDTTTEGLLSFDDWMKNKGYTKNTSGAWQRQGEKITMSYVSPETFEEYVEQYVNTGTEEARLQLISHFTLEKNTYYSKKEISRENSLDGFLFLGDSNTVRIRDRDSLGINLSDENETALEGVTYRAEVGVAADYWITNINQLPSSSEVNGVCVLLGINNIEDTTSMKQLIDLLAERYSGKNIYIESVLHVGEAYTTIDASTMNSKVDEFNKEIEDYCKYKNNVYYIDITRGLETNDGYLDPSITTDGLHLNSLDTLIENIRGYIIDTDDYDEESSTSGEETDSEEDTEKNEEKENAENEASLLAEPDLTSEGYHAPLNPYDASGYWGQCTWFAWGRFYEIYGYSPGFVSSGKFCAEELVNAHPDEFELSSDEPKAGAIFSCGGGGRATSAEHGHVGVVIPYDGNTIVTDEGNVSGSDWKRLTYTIEEFRAAYPNGLVFANPKNSPSISSASTQNAKYYVKIATWSETTDVYTTNDEEEEGYTIGPVYEVTETKINYYDMVKSYTMPFDYLWALMVITEDRDFVLGLADLVYGSDMEITINDNLTETTTTKDYTYEKQTEIYSEVDVRESEARQKTDTISAPYTAQLKTTTRTNTIEAALTRANTWIVDYRKDYIYQVPETTTPQDKEEREATERNETMPSDYERTDNTEDPLGLRAEVEAEGKDVISITNRYKSANINWKEVTTTTVVTTKYLGKTADIREKTSKLRKEGKLEKNEFIYKEKNFVTLLLSNEKARSNILDTRSWLYEILQNNDSTKEMFEDLTKYLLYKTTGNDAYGINDFDFSIFSPGAFNSVSDIQGGNAQEMVWYALRSAGYSEIATAAAMGNIANESGFDSRKAEGQYGNSYTESVDNGTYTNFIEDKIGYGLCQWTDSGRKGRLYKYAKESQENTSIGDIEMQIQYFLGELNPAGGADGYAKFQMPGNSSSAYNGISYTYNDWKDATDIEDATWAFMALFERPRYDPSTNHIDRRIEDSKKYYEMYSGRDLDSFKKAEDDSKESSED